MYSETGRDVRVPVSRFHSRLFLLLAFANVLSLTGLIHAQTRLLAPVPPMGWNSWDAYGTTIREDEVKANADAMASELKAYGWQYIVVDIQWYEPNAKAHGYRDGAMLSMDGNGRLVPAVNRFPSAADGVGFTQLAGYVHSKGLKFGIHILRGIPRQAVEQNLPVLGTKVRATSIADKASVCAWNKDMYGVDMSKPGAQAYYDSIVKLYASWGVDFIKADDMTRPYHGAEIAALHRAIAKSGRAIVLSLSPGPAPTVQVDDLRTKAEMWRIEDDLWDNWKAVKGVYADAERWLPLVKEGHWPDADMLPLGRIGMRAERGDDRLSRLTDDEQRTVMSLWAMLRSPLIFGGDLPSLDPFTRGLLTNRDVLEIDQHGSAARAVYSQDELHVWAANDERSNAKYIAVFNLSDEPARVRLDWKQLKVEGAPARMRELWSGATVASPDAIDASVAAHGTMLYRLEFDR
jgi:hypothetical protein